MNLPKFITFTGWDDGTPVHELHLLAAEYPVEFGVLFSPKRQGSSRYPTLTYVRYLLENRGRLRLAAHLCGAHSKELLSSGTLEQLLFSAITKFDRVQVNTSDTVRPADIAALEHWGAKHRVMPILQYRAGRPPMGSSMQWLFDASGGNGIEPPSWPQSISDWQAKEQFKGFAGGLNPENVAKHVETIGAHEHSYWIDMETGVRDAEDRFSLAKCRRVCEAVYGVR